MEINCVWNKKSSTRLGGPSFDFLFSVEIWFFYRKIFLLHREYILARFSKFVVSLSSIFLYLYTSLYLTRVDLNWLLIEVTCHFFFLFFLIFRLLFHLEVKWNSMDKMEKSVQSVRDLILKYYISTSLRNVNTNYHWNYLFNLPNCKISKIQPHPPLLFE